MGMGTASCFPADVCVAALAPSEPGTPPASLPLWGMGPAAVSQAGGDLEGCRSLPGHRSCLPWHSSAH